MKVTPAQLASTRPEALREVLRNMPSTIAEPVKGLSEVAGHYIAAAYFTCTGDLDQPEASATLAPDAAMRALADCAAFMHSVGAATLLHYEHAGGNLAQFGHDLWLTRNGHGAGFWDRDNLQADGVYGGKACSLGGHLSALAREMGECDLVQGDDGFLYLE